jgi:hypothetical protein
MAEADLIPDIYIGASGSINDAPAMLTQLPTRGKVVADGLGRVREESRQAHRSDGRASRYVGSRMGIR